MTDESNLTAKHILDELEKLKQFTVTKQDILAHPIAMARIKAITEQCDEIPFGPLGFPIHTVDWIDPDSYFLGPQKTIQAILSIAEKYGPEIGKALLEKLTVETPEDDTLETP